MSLFIACDFRIHSILCFHSSRVDKSHNATDSTMNAIENTATHQPGGTASNALTPLESGQSSTDVSYASTEVYHQTYEQLIKYGQSIDSRRYHTREHSVIWYGVIQRRD